LRKVSGLSPCQGVDHRMFHNSGLHNALRLVSVILNRSSTRDMCSMVQSLFSMVWASPWHKCHGNPKSSCSASLASLHDKARGSCPIGSNRIWDVPAGHVSYRSLSTPSPYFCMKLGKTSQEKSGGEQENQRNSSCFIAVVLICHSICHSICHNIFHS
jgi:hypothetical protein